MSLMNRRFAPFICSLAAVTLVAARAAHADRVEQPLLNNTAQAELQSRLEALQSSAAGAGPLAGAAISVHIDGKRVWSGGAGCATFSENLPQRCERPFGPDTKVRVASVSKMAVALTALKLAREGRLDLDRPASDYLGWRLSHPAFPEMPITVRILLMHLSSIRDPEEYWAEAPNPFRNLFVTPEAFAASGVPSEDAPGAYFTYANLNYGVVAAVLENATGQRFDILVREQVLAPLGLDAGFNWSGVSRKARRRAAAPHRFEGGKWQAKTDLPATLRGDEPFFLAAPDLDRRAYLADYIPGENASLFGPQGGLRASADDLAKLALAAAEFPEATADPWIYDAARRNGDTLGGLIHAYGLGVQIVEGAPIPRGARLIGHAGEAYGLYSGAWRVEPEGASGPAVTIGYVINGTTSTSPLPSANAAFNVAEEALLALGLEAAQRATATAEAPKDHDDDPRPFDRQADASADVDVALARAGIEGKRALIVMGGNWCHDSRGLAGYNEQADIASLIASQYVLVYVDVGQKNRNLDIARRFGVTKLIGTPTVVIAEPDGTVVNAATAHDWRNAASRSTSEWIDYLDEHGPSPTQ